MMTHLLEGVVQHGTGQGAKSLGRPVSGKTGTSSDYGDAWFIGYTPSVLAAVWVGFDDKSSLGKDETGARAALPIWISFMNQALKGTPVETFKVPPGVTLVRVNLETGLPDTTGSQETVVEAFLDGTVPFLVWKTGAGRKRELPQPYPRGRFFRVSESTPLDVHRTHLIFRTGETMKDEEIKSMLGRCKTIAVVGISPKEDRPSYTVASYLKSKGTASFPSGRTAKRYLEKRFITALRRFLRR